MAAPYQIITSLYEGLNRVIPTMVDAELKSDLYTVGSVGALLGASAKNSFIPEGDNLLGPGVTEFDKQALDTAAPWVTTYHNTQSSSRKSIMPGGTDVSPPATGTLEGAKTAKYGWTRVAQGISIDNSYIDFAVRGIQGGKSTSEVMKRLIDPLNEAVKRAMSEEVSALQSQLLNGSVASGDQGNMFADNVTGVLQWVDDVNTCGGVDRNTSAGVGYRGQVSNANVAVSFDLFDKADNEGLARSGGPSGVTATKPLANYGAEDRYVFLSGKQWNALFAEAKALGLILTQNSNLIKEGVFGYKGSHFTYKNRTFIVDLRLSDTVMLDLDPKSWQLAYNKLLAVSELDSMAQKFRGAGLPMQTTGVIESIIQLRCKTPWTNLKMTNLIVPA